MMAPDAATLPSPPDFAPWSNGNRSRGGVGGMSRPGSYPNGGSPSPAGSRPPPKFPNIKDLQDQAAALDVTEGTPLSTLTRTAQDAIETAKVLVDENQLDQAYVQYLRASEITVNLIPRHPEYRAMASQRPGWYKEFADLMMAVRMKQGTMDEIKQQILQDNIYSNVAASSSSSIPSSPRGRQNDSSSASSIRMPSPTEFQRAAGALQSKLNTNRYSAPPAEDMLAQRFARLKATSPPTNDPGPGRAGNLAMPMSSGYDDSDDYYPSRPPSNLSQQQGSPPAIPPRRPLGPRTMPSPQIPPTLPPKIPVMNTSLPRAPDPAYSPITTVPSQPPSNPPRTSTESSRGSTSRYNHILESPRGGSPMSMNNNNGGLDENPYRSQTPNGLQREPQNSTADLPHHHAIHAQELLDYLRQYNVLLIDVRTREHYDNGHIYAKSVICVEPVVLKENVSAEELEERLVVSPEHEQALFEQRNEFDMVVYYDQGTDSVNYLAGSPVGTSAPHLRALHDTLYEFNAYKPLKDGRPPALLLGGLDAWIDLMGQNSLATSSTAIVMGSIQAKRPVRKPGRPLGRVPTMVSANSSLEVRKRRLREYKPLNPEELTAWMEKSRVEEIDTSAYIQDQQPLTEEPEEEAGFEGDTQNQSQRPASFVHTYEDFLRRFPEPHAMQESMTVPQTRPPVMGPPLPALPPFPGTAGAPPVPNYAAPQIPAPSRPPPAVPRPKYSGVSDGRQTQPPLARQNSATKTALYTSNSALDRLKLPRTGLTNFGVTCYMNSTLQCLSATMMLSKFFIDNRFRHYVQKNWKGSQGVMPGLFANLIRSLWKNDVEVIMPTSFRNFCGRLNQEWAIDRQQDAKEFFDFVVDCLHEDLNINWQRTPLRPLTFAEEMQRERMAVPRVSRIEWERYCHREESFISSLFAGQHASRLRCTTCRRTSTTYEAFYSISVEIPPSGTGDIYQSLRSYCQEEMLSGDEVWKCPYCKCERVATKQIIITRAPQILVVHFKRFSASKTQSARKIHTPVEFPLYGLKMDPFVISSSSPMPEPTTTATTTTAATSSSNGNSATVPPFTYDCYGVLRHIGTSMSSGHYISLVRDAQRHCWRKFDDDRTTDFNPRDLRHKDRLQNEQAYIVFYERVPAK